MNRKHQFRARVKNKNYDYLENYQIINVFGNISETLDAIIEEHEELKRKTWNLEYVAGSVASQVNEALTNELKKIRLGTNNTDRNTQILIEVLQGFIQMQNIEHIITTNEFKPTFLTEAESVVQDKIAHQKQRKHSRQ